MNNETQTVTVPDVLRRAAEIHAERGGCKNILETDDGRVCMWGAIEAAIQGLHLDYDTQYDAVHRVMAFYFPIENEWDELYPGGNSFNDLAETTDLDVQKVLGRIADEIEFPS
jgi:hypothetical protein